ncbi:cell wall hydrolase [Aestuariibius insulae]|uniref:cell wall hydrolase n=1 Tax=Aestuariibius insulae TaxID=2058287 RepID=UPI00345E23BE
MIVKTFGFRAVAVVCAFAVCGVAQASELMSARLGALLGSDLASIEPAPASDAMVFSAPVVVTEASIALDVDESEIEYNRSFLAELPEADGGQQWECLSEALYFEARGESVSGIFAVAEVIMNRVESARYPDTVCEVVNQGTGRKYACQFSYTCDGIAEVINEPRAYARVGKVARLLLDGAPRQLTQGATHYHTKAVNPNWASVFPKTAAIGAHYFYREITRTAASS